MTRYLENLDKFLKNMRAWSYSKWTGTLEWTLLLPFRNTEFAEKFSAIVTFHWFYRDFKTDATNE